MERMKLKLIRLLGKQLNLNIRNRKLIVSSDLAIRDLSNKS